jgi:DMSO reductase family type II enzyme chaperone
VPQIEDLETAEELQAAARSRLYDLLARAFAVPDQPFYQAIREGAFAAQVSENLAALPYALALGDGHAVRQQLCEAAGHRELQSEYIRLFDVGTPRPPCPLYGGEYKKGRKGVMEELIRFYNYFGLHPSPRSRDMPDHITIELEFMHFVIFREVAALHHQQDRTSYLRAERDFLERHLCAWVPRLRERLQRQQPPAFYAALTRLAEGFLAADLGYLQGMLQPNP